jgi:hypothetical protein
MPVQIAKICLSELGVLAERGRKFFGKRLFDATGISSLVDVTGKGVIRMALAISPLVPGVDR